MFNVKINKRNGLLKWKVFITIGKKRVFYMRGWCICIK